MVSKNGSHEDSSSEAPEKSVSSDRHSSSNGTSENPPPEQRDEAGEVRQMARDETRRVRLWRIVVTLLLLAVAVAVTATTYIFLIREQHANFRTGVSNSTK